MKKKGIIKLFLFVTKKVSFVLAIKILVYEFFVFIFSACVTFVGGGELNYEIQKADIENIITQLNERGSNIEICRSKENSENVIAGFAASYSSMGIKLVYTYDSEKHRISLKKLITIKDNNEIYGWPKMDFITDSNYILPYKLIIFQLRVFYAVIMPFMTADTYISYFIDSAIASFCYLNIYYMYFICLTTIIILFLKTLIIIQKFYKNVIQELI